MKATEDNAGKVQERRLLVLAVSLFAVAITVFGGLWWQQKRAMQPNNAAVQTPRVAAGATPQRKAEMVAKAQELRTKFAPWAKQHQAVLKRMIQAKPDDKAAMTAVWGAVPPFSEKIGVSAEEMMPTGDPTVGVGFTYAGTEKWLATAPPNSDLKPGVNDSVKVGMQQLSAARQKRFARMRDMDIAQSYSGQTLVILYVSGRITQQKRLPPSARPALLRKLKAEGRKVTMIDLFDEPQEIAPTYDFLR